MSHTDTTTVSEKFNAVDTSIAQANSNIASINSSLSGVNESLATKQGILSAGAGIAISGNTISTKVYPSNPNLLDNWYFKNPVNQRGQTSYTVTDYAIDRWISQGCTVTLNDGYLTIAGKYLNLDQVVDEYVWKFLRGRTVTISILARGNVAVITEDYAAHYVGLYNNSASFSLASVTLTVRDDASQFVFHIQPQDENAVDIIAVKLELGTEQTLAHQDANGNWVLNEIPDYREQLRRCQKYFVKFGDSNFFHALGVAIARTSENLSLVLPLPTQMGELVFPSLQLIGSITCRHGDANYVYPTQAVVDALGVGTLLIKITASGLTPGDAYEVFLGPESYLFISEEL